MLRPGGGGQIRQVAPGVRPLGVLAAAEVQLQAMPLGDGAHRFQAGTANAGRQHVAGGVAIGRPDQPTA